MPHCSRDLELTEQRLHSFRWDKTQSWVVSRVSFSGGKKSSNPSLCPRKQCGEEEEEVEVSRREKATLPPEGFQALCQEPAFALGTKETLSSLW